VLLRRVRSVRSVRPEVTLGTCRFIALLASTATAIAVLTCSAIAHPAALSGGGHVVQHDAAAHAAGEHVHPAQ